MNQHHDPGDENDAKPEIYSAIFAGIPLSASAFRRAGLAAVEQYSKAATSDPPDRLLYTGALGSTDAVNLISNRAHILERSTLTEFDQESGSGGIL